MLVGLGVDLVAVPRVRSELARDPVGFKNSLFTAREIAECDLLIRSAQQYAVRFAAKEAFLKALGTGAPNTGAFRQIEVLKQGQSRPRIVLHDAMAHEAESRGVRAISVSLDQRREWAVAAVILEGV